MKAKALNALLTFARDKDSRDDMSRLIARGTAKAHNLLDDSGELKAEYSELIDDMTMLGDKGGKPKDIINLALKTKIEPEQKPETVDDLYNRLKHGGLR